MGGAIAGALTPETVHDEWFEIVAAVNTDDLVGTAMQLVRKRR